jgi:hypothetical protein
VAFCLVLACLLLTGSLSFFYSSKGCREIVVFIAFLFRPMRSMLVKLGYISSLVAAMAFWKAAEGFLLMAGLSFMPTD